MLPNDQWRVGGENREGCDSGAPDQFRGAEEGLGGAGQTIQEAAGGDGKMEGECCSYYLA